VKRLGIIGGIGPESTIAYYRAVVAAYREIAATDASPPVIINSIDVRQVLHLAEHDRASLTQYLLDELQRLANAGAALGLLAANTPHLVFDDLVGRSPLPLLSIVEATRDAALARGFRRVGLFGTRFTMQGRFYHDEFRKASVDLVVPHEDEQASIHQHYVTELVNGTFLPGTRDAVLGIIDLMKERDKIDAGILAGTELPLLLADGPASVPLLDTAQIHVRAAAERLWGGST
jgi:aspartate racemase